MSERPHAEAALEFAPRIAIAGGGTGGHLYPGLALADGFRDADPATEIIFIGTERGLEARIVPEYGYKLFLIPMQGLQRRLTLSNLMFPVRLAASIHKCTTLFDKFKPHLVVGTGGYVSGPALTAAKLRGIPRVIQEQNSYPGLVNRRLGKRVDAVFLTFDTSRRYFEGAQNVIVSGNPIRSALRHSASEARYADFSFSPEKKTLLVFGGSQGARGLNEVVASMLPGLMARDDVQVLWIVGKAWLETWEPLAREHKNLRVLGYVDDMARVYAIADLAVCRAGASTISELTTCGIPAVYVPYPHATADHQTANALAVVEAGGGVLLPESRIAGELADEVHALLDDESRLQQMAKDANTLSMHDAAGIIVVRCRQLIHAHYTGTKSPG